MLVGQRVGPFEIEKQLGSGAMGSVYRARYCKTGQKVALKIMAPGLGGNETSLARFEREAEVLKRLSHRNIVRFYIASEFQGAPYYAMEYIEGESLDHVLQRRGRLTWEEVVELGKQLCAALQHAHEQGIVHRDLKPSNLMLTADGTLKLTDFGIAKDLDVTQLTAVNCTVGTAAYMSPEQCRGERNLTHKSDLYSLGVLLYELLTGQRPFEARTTMDMFLQHVNVVPERPSRMVLDIPVWLDNLVCQLLEKKPEHRPFDAAVVAQALDQVAAKVAAQQSVGIEAVKARRQQRSGSNGPTQDTDQKVARTLLTGLHRTRRKRRTRPLYERSWFQAAAISLLLLVVIGILYAVFKAPSAEVLFARAQRLMETNTEAAVTQARNGPIKDYLDNYGDRADAPTRQIRDWADRYDVSLREKQMDNRRKLSPEGEAETLARRAVHCEETGDWDGAREQWKEGAKYKREADTDLRIWGLLAEKRLQELAAAAEFENELMAQVSSYYLNVDVFKAIAVHHAQEALAALSGLDLGPPLDQAFRAMRYEMFGDHAAAQAAWQALKERCERKGEQRAWFLLAAKRAHELSRSMPAASKEDETRARLKHIKDALDEARRLAAEKRPPERLQAGRICGDILDLYHRFPDFRDSPEPGLKELVEQAQQLSAQLAQEDQSADRGTLQDPMKPTRVRSREAYERACRVLPGGVNSPARAFAAVGGQPLFITRAEGPYLFDLDGNRYLDYVGSWGPLILGHAHPRVVHAVEEALRRGTSFGAPTELETRLAELISSAVPSIEMVRLVSSGTEASMSAIRLARGFTRRDGIIKFAGCYHGHVDSLLVQAGSSATTLGVPNSPGIPKGCTADTLVLRYNDVAQLAEAFRAHGNRIAGVIVEPVAGNMGLVTPRPGFLAELRRLTTHYGALLIYDEVMTGFRLAYGGAQQLYGQRPDLTVLGKIVGGGLPVGAYGGRAEIMKHVLPAGPVFQAGTLSGNPLAMAAGLATLEELRDHPPYARLEQLGGLLAERLSGAAAEANVPHQLARVGSMWTLFFNAEPVRDYDAARKSDTERFARFFWAMLDRGIYLPCSQFEAAFVSAVHTEEHVAQTIVAAREALAEIAQV